MSETEWLEDHVELYVAGGMPPDETARFERELGLLPPVERRLYDARIADAGDVLADFVGTFAAEPPEYLRRDVLDRAFAAGTPPRSIESVRERRRWAPMLAAAAAAAVVALGAGVIVGRTTAPEPAPTVSTAQQSLLNVLEAPDAKITSAALAGDRGQISVVSSRSQNRAVTVLADLGEPLPADRAYQLWLLGKDGSELPVSAGLIAPDATGAPAHVAGLDGSTALAITVEPREGSAQPTTPVLAAVDL